MFYIHNLIIFLKINIYFFNAYNIKDDVYEQKNKKTIMGNVINFNIFTDRYVWVFIK